MGKGKHSLLRIPAFTGISSENTIKFGKYLLNVSACPAASLKLRLVKFLLHLTNAYYKGQDLQSLLSTSLTSWTSVYQVLRQRFLQLGAMHCGKEVLVIQATHMARLCHSMLLNCAIQTEWHCVETSAQQSLSLSQASLPVLRNRKSLIWISCLIYVALMAYFPSQRSSLPPSVFNTGVRLHVLSAPLSVDVVMP